MIDPDVAYLNAAFPKYPVTIDDKGWIVGVWWCPTWCKRSAMYGQFPLSFRERALALFHMVPDHRILHCPSGLVRGPGVTVDIRRLSPTCPQIIASAGELPFADGSFDFVLSDPPYTPKDMKVYGTGRFPFMKFIREAHRVLAPGGFLGMLHLWPPSWGGRRWKMRGIIGVVTGANKRVRAFSLLKKIASRPGAMLPFRAKD